MGGAYDEDSRRGYDNPYVSAKENREFQQEMPRKLPVKSDENTNKMSLSLQKEIASRYGGSNINTAETRALGTAKFSRF